LEKQLYKAAEDDNFSEASSPLRDHPEINVNWTDEYQWTPLHTASYSGHVEVVKLLLAHPDIDVNLKESSGLTTLSFGCYCDHVSVVEVLLKDPRVDVSLEDINGRTPLWHASRKGKHEVIEWFIASGRDLGDIKNKKGNGKAKATPPLILQESTSKVKLCRCLEDSWPAQH